MAVFLNDSLKTLLIFKILTIFYMYRGFSEICISTNDLLEYLDISRPTLQKRLQVISDNNLLIIEKRDRNKFYSLDLDSLVDLSEK